MRINHPIIALSSCIILFHFAIRVYVLWPVAESTIWVERQPGATIFHHCFAIETFVKLGTNFVGERPRISIFAKIFPIAGRSWDSSRLFCSRCSWPCCCSRRCGCSTWLCSWVVGGWNWYARVNYFDISTSVELLLVSVSGSGSIFVSSPRVGCVILPLKHTVFTFKICWNLKPDFVPVTALTRSGRKPVLNAALIRHYLYLLPTCSHICWLKTTWSGFHHLSFPIKKNRNRNN